MQAWLYWMEVMAPKFRPADAPFRITSTNEAYTRNANRLSFA